MRTHRDASDASGANVTKELDYDDSGEGEGGEVIHNFLERHRLKFKERQRLMLLRQKVEAAMVIQVCARCVCACARARVCDMRPKLPRRHHHNFTNHTHTHTHTHTAHVEKLQASRPLATAKDEASVSTKVT
jgi:hypothetical protein